MGDVESVNRGNAASGPPASPPSAGRGGRRGHLVIVVVFIVLIGMVSLFGALMYRRQAGDIRREAGQGLTAVRRLQSDQIRLWFLDQKSDAELLRADPSIVGSLSRAVDGRPGQGTSKALERMLRLYRKSHEIEAIGVFDPRLEAVVLSPSTEAFGSRAKALAETALRSESPQFSDIYRVRGGDLVADLATPILGPAASGAHVIGVLVLRIDPGAELFPILATWPMTSRTGESVLLGVRDGRILLLSRPLLRRAGPLSMSLPLTDERLVAVQAARGETGVRQGLDYRHVEVLASAGRIGGTPWYLVAEQDLSVIETPIRDSAVATTAWAAVIVTLAGLLLLLYWRGREARALRERVAAEKERRRLETRYATLMREAGEAIVLMDAGGRVVEANDAALELYGRSVESFVGETVDVFRPPNLKPTFKERFAAADAAGGHLVFESLHRRSDGAELPVVVGLTALEIEGEAFYLQVARDISERKAAAVALSESEERYRTLFANSLSGVALHEIVLDEEGRPVDFRFLAANPAFETQSGLRVTDVIGRRGSEVMPDIAETGLIELGGRVALSGEPARVESYVPSLRRHLDIQVVSPKPGQFATLFVDISKRREAEEIIAGFFSSSPVGMFILDRDLRYVRANPMLAEMDGVPDAERLGRTIAEASPRLAAAIVPLLTRVVDLGETLERIDVEGLEARADGVARFAQATVFPIKDPHGHVRFVGGVLVDATEERGAGKALEESSQFLERILAVTPEIIYIFDVAERRMVFWNREMEDVLGHTPGDLAGMDAEAWGNLVHAGDLDALSAYMHASPHLDDGEVREVEYRVRRSDGDWRVLHSRDTPFARDETGAVAQLIGTALDVTEQRRAETAFVETSSRLEATIHAAPIAIVALDADERIVLWNPAAVATFGWSADETVGQPVRFLAAGEEKHARDLWRRAHGGEQFAGVDLPCVRKDGSSIATSTSIAGLRAADDQNSGVLLLIVDVSDQRANLLRLTRVSRLYQVLSAVAEAIPRVREPQRLYEELCRIVVEQGEFPMAWVGAAGDDGVVRVLASAGAGRDFLADLSIDTRASTGERSPMWTALRDSRIDTCPDIDARARTGGASAARAAASGFRSSAAVPIVVDGRARAALAIYSVEAGAFDAEEVGLLERLAGDVAFAIEAAAQEDARHRAESDLAELNADLELRVTERTAELEVANAELEAFSYSASHDLRAPLRALDGFSLALVEDHGDRLDEQAADYLARIRAASQRMARLIDDLLMLSRVTRREMKRERVDLSALARRVLQELADADPDRDVAVRIADGMVVQGDAHLLEVALRNLLANAWKFTSRTEAASIEMDRESADDGVAFSVRDNGAGFDARYADQLFTPFQRLHGDEFPGTGIGLATVQRIIRRHGGVVWAEGETGRGATVHFTLAHGGRVDEGAPVDPAGGRQ